MKIKDKKILTFPGKTGRDVQVTIETPERWVQDHPRFDAKRVNIQCNMKSKQKEERFSTSFWMTKEMWRLWRAIADHLLDVEQMDQIEAACKAAP